MAAAPARDWTNKPLESHWKFYAVDVKTRGGERALAVTPHVVRMLMRKGREGLVAEPMVFGEGKQRRDIKIRKLSEMQVDFEPGWWENTQQHSQHFADEEVLVQQSVEPNTEGRKPWRMIVRVYGGSVLDRWLSSNPGDPEYDQWTKDMVVQHSTCQAIFEIGHKVDNDDLPIAYSGRGGVQNDLLAHTTLMGNGDNTVPNEIFEVTGGNDAEYGRMKKLDPDPSSGGQHSQFDTSSLKEEFYFNSDGHVVPADGGFIAHYFYGRVVTKGWWFRKVGWALTAVILTVMNKYAMMFAFLSMRVHYHKFAVVYLVIMMSFEILVIYFSWLLTKEDMGDPIHRDDLAVANSEFASKYMVMMQVVLYCCQVPNAVKEIVIWMCHRGGVMAAH